MAWTPYGWGCRRPAEAKDEDRVGEATTCGRRGRCGPWGELFGATETEPAPDRGAGSGKDDDVTLPDIGKLSVTEKKKDDMDVDQEGSKKDSTGTKEPTPRGTEAGKTDPSEITNFKGATFEEYRKTAPDYMSTAGREMIGGSFPRTLR